MLRDTAAQDRVIERPHLWRRHRTLILVAAGFVAMVAVVGLFLFRFSGVGVSVSRDRVSIATVERGNFVRDVAADGQVVAAVSPTLYANVAGTVTLKVHAGDAVSRGQQLASIDSPDLAAKLSQEEATLQGLKIDWQRARLDADHRLLQLRDAYSQAEVDQKTAQRELERSRKAYELGAYSELQALRAEDSLEKAKFAFAQAKVNYQSQPELNKFDIDSKKALLDRQQFMVTDLERQVAALSVRSPVDGQIGQVQVPDRASARGDQDGLSLGETSGPQRAKRHRPDGREHAGGLKAELRRYRDEPVGPGEDVVGIGVLQQGGDARAGQRRIGVRADRLDGSDNVPGQRGGQLAVVQRAGAGGPADQDIEVVHADRLGADKHLPGAGRGHFSLFDRQYFRAAVGVVTHAPHGIAS